MNLTLAVDETVVQRARTAAAAMGKSLNQVVREYLEELAAMDDADAWCAELRRLSLEAHGDSKGWKFNRDEIHERS